MGAKLDAGLVLVAAGTSMQVLLHLGGTCIKHIGQGLPGQKEQQECELESGTRVFPVFVILTTLFSSPWPSAAQATELEHAAGLYFRGHSCGEPLSEADGNRQAIGIQASQTV